jgi:hypothetical protein
MRLARATTSLIGLAVGDALGGFFEFAGSATGAAHKRQARHALRCMYPMQGHCTNGM